MLIRGGEILHPSGERLERADVLIEGDRIARVAPEISPPDGTLILDATERIVLPGLINAHTHAHNNLMKGVAGKWTLEDHISHSLALLAGRTPEEQYISAAIGAVEMLKTGCTAAYDLYLAVPATTQEGTEAVVRAYADVGMRAVVAPAMSDISFYETVPGLLDLLSADLRQTVESMETAPTEGLLAQAEETIRRWNGFADGRIHTAVAPTIPGQCTDEFLAGCRRLVEEYGVGCHTHLVETKVQAVNALNRWGTTVVSRLAEIGLLGPFFTGAHAVWLTDEDIELLAATGSNLAHNPASNLRLGSGTAPVREMLDAGVNVGLGTDGVMSSDNLDMFEAMRFAVLSSRVRFPHQQEPWLDATDVWHMATEGSARTLGVVADIGAIDAGRKADLALLRADSVFLRPINNALNALVFAETGASVDSVLVDGRLVVQGGRVLTVDEKQVVARAQETAERLHRENREAILLADRITPYLSQACRSAAIQPFAVNRYGVPVG